MSHKNYDFKIVKALLRSSNHIRGLANDLGTNQTTIARIVKKLYEDNVVDFKFEGKNKVVFLKKTLETKQFVFCVESMNFCDLLKKYPALRRIFELIQKKQNIKLAILFGSYAKLLAKKDSDIDIYIDTIDKQIKEEVELIDSRINVKIGRYDCDSLLIKEIFKNHVLIKGIEIYYEKNKFFD